MACSVVSCHVCRVFFPPALDYILFRACRVFFMDSQSLPVIVRLQVFFVFIAFMWINAITVQ
jgi:hypothetical protein